MVQRPQQQSEVEQPLVEPLHDHVGVAAEQVQAHLGAVLAKAGEHVGHELHDARLAAAEVHVAAERLVFVVERRLGPLHEVDHLLRAVAQEGPLFG